MPEQHKLPLTVWIFNLTLMSFGLSVFAYMAISDSHSLNSLPAFFILFISLAMGVLPLILRNNLSITHISQNTFETTNTQMNLRDEVTGLSSRSLFLEQLEIIIKQNKRNKGTFALLSIDINRFKEVNDSLGHKVGDQLLKEAAERLENLLREVDTIGRLGDDEFAIILDNVNKENAELVVDKISNVFTLPFFIAETQLLTSVSVGVALYPEHAESTREIITCANSAMNYAKSHHFNSAYYDPTSKTNQVQDLSLAVHLREALKDNQLQLFYQPKYSSKDNRVIEAEALLRWIHPEKGFIPPDQIVHAAEGSGLIHPLTDWVLETAIKQQKAWRDKNIDIGIAVNLSVYNLQNPQLVTMIKYFMLENQISPDKLILEVTEGAMMQNPTQALDILSKLNDMDIKIAIDDFGTGYSSLAYLKTLPVDELKIDRSFVMNLKDDENDLAIVRSTIDLAHNLSLSVVAEGVENNESWDILDELGCDVIQGFYLSKPLPPKEFEPWYHEFLSKGRASLS